MWDWTWGPGGPPRPPTWALTRPDGLLALADVALTRHWGLASHVGLESHTWDSTWDSLLTAHAAHLLTQVPNDSAPLRSALAFCPLTWR